MNCLAPIDEGILADYWLAMLTSSEEEEVELHLFGCDECGTRLREVIALAEGVREVAREGSLRMIVSEAFVRRAAENGLRVREYAPAAGGAVQCTVTAEDDILIGRLAADLSRAKRVDLCVCDGAGVEQLRLPDIPFRSGSSSILFQHPMWLAKAAPTSKTLMRLVAVDELGDERLLGEYTFDHQRSLPGPGTWLGF